MTRGSRHAARKPETGLQNGGSVFLCIMLLQQSTAYDHQFFHNRLSVRYALNRQCGTQFTHMFVGNIGKQGTTSPRRNSRPRNISRARRASLAAECGRVAPFRRTHGRGLVHRVRDIFPCGRSATCSHFTTSLLRVAIARSLRGFAHRKGWSGPIANARHVVFSLRSRPRMRRLAS